MKIAHFRWPSASQKRACLSSLTDRIWLYSVLLPLLTTASSCMEDRCLGCLGASTEISQPLDSETLPWLAIPVTQPWAPTSSHPGTCHTELNSGKRGRGRGEGKRKPAGQLQTQLQKPLWYATPKHATTLGGTEPALPTADRWPLDKYQLLFVVNLVKLHLTASNGRAENQSRSKILL